MKRERVVLSLILAVYLLLGTLYAFVTPLWQAPDEPAHFNYVRQVAATQRLPVLQHGDYDQTYLDEIKSRKFPADMPVDEIRYEGHQPPLYYWLATPLYWLARPFGLAAQVRVLRMFGVVLGAGIMFLIWISARRLFPQQPAHAPIAAAFAAFLPMHLAMMASVNNDPLAELLIAAGMFRLLGHLKDPQAPPRAWATTGLIVGLGMITKFQAYILLPLAGSVWLWQLWQRRSRGERGGAPWLSGLAGLIPAILLALPWWLRNISVYGPADPLGLDRHNAIVTGQPRTLDWIAANGWDAYLDRLADFTFQSFWGVFGWLGVFMDSRIYTLLGVLSLLVAVGLLWQLRRRRQGQSLSPFQRRGLVLLGLQLLAVAVAYLWYNIDFVQHQGRYFFPALLAISIFFALGLEGVLAPGGSRWGMIAAFGMAILLGAFGLLAGDIPGWTLLMLAGSGIVLGIRNRWSGIPTAGWAAAVLALLALIAVQALFGAIAPQLG